MKKILIPTDFSVKASYAVHYGAKVAHEMNAGIVLFHAYHFPILTEAAVMQQSTLEDWEKDIKSELRKIASSIHKKYPLLPVETATRLGFAVDEILSVAAEYHADLIVMGSKGMGSFGDNFLGNVTSDIIRDTKIPILIIPPDVSDNPVKKMVLACYDEHLITEKVESTILDFVRTFKAELYILDVIREPAEPISVPYEQTSKMRDHFTTLNPSIHITEDEKVIHGINAFSEQKNIDLIVMIPEKHNLFERMFTEIHTRHMAHDTKRPLLIIPNK